MNITYFHTAELSPTYWRDTHVRIEGAAVWPLQRIFIEDWHFATEEAPLEGAELFPPGGRARKHIAQIVASGPDHDHLSIHRTFFAAMTRATSPLRITTPYFVPDEATMTALCTAALRRLDMRVLIRKRSDSRLVDLAARSYVAELLASARTAPIRFLDDGTKRFAATSYVSYPFIKRLLSVKETLTSTN